MASLSRASNSAHCILVGSGITSPAYRYVVTGALVPPVHDLFSISRFPPVLSTRLQCLCNPYLAGLSGLRLPAIRAITSVTRDGPFPAFPGYARWNRELVLCLQCVHSAAWRLHALTAQHLVNPSSGPAWCAGSGPPANCASSSLPRS